MVNRYLFSSLIQARKSLNRYFFSFLKPLAHVAQMIRIERERQNVGGLSNVIVIVVIVLLFTSSLLTGAQESSCRALFRLPFNTPVISF